MAVGVIMDFDGATLEQDDAVIVAAAGPSSAPRIEFLAVRNCISSGTAVTDVS